MQYLWYTTCLCQRKMSGLEKDMQLLLKPNHFAIVCHEKKLRLMPHQKNQVHCVNETDSEDSDLTEWVNALYSYGQQCDKNVACEMLIAAKPVTFQIDIDASVNLLPECNVPKHHRFRRQQNS